MPCLNFTIKSIDALPLPTDRAQVDYRDETLPGFGLRVSAQGARAWTVVYRYNQRLRRLTLGRYPSMSLADARVLAKEAFRTVALGQDPAEMKSRERLAETFRELAHEYLEKHAKRNKKSWKQDERILNRDVLPQWGHLKAKEISRRNVRTLLDAITDRGAGVLANRTLALVRKVFNFGIQRDIVSANPCHMLPRPTEEHARERVLTFDEISDLWATFDQMDFLIGSIFKVYLLTAQRGAEIRSMRWDELDLNAGWWTIPEGKTKNGLSHRIPLSTAVMELLEELREYGDGSPWVFPSPLCPGQHIDNIQKAIQRVRSQTGFSFVGHDLRRTAASHMAGMGVPRLVISKILNHVEQGVTKVYDRHSYDMEKREALERWALKLREILKAGNTYPLKRTSSMLAESVSHPPAA